MSPDWLSTVNLWAKSHTLGTKGVSLRETPLPQRDMCVPRCADRTESGAARAEVGLAQRDALGLELGLELVADAVARLQEGVPRRTMVDLLAQLAHEDVVRPVAVRRAGPRRAGAARRG